jgi:hypothetical protein
MSGRSKVSSASLNVCRSIFYSGLVYFNCDTNKKFETACLPPPGSIILSLGEQPESAFCDRAYLEATMSDQFKICQEFLKATGYYTDIPFDMTRPYDMADYPGAYKSYPQARTFDLPKKNYSQESTSVRKVFSRRRSLRNFLQTPVSMDDLGFLLWATQGIITAAIGEHGLRAAPSAGALYPVETYLVSRAVEALPQGTFHFNVKNFSLELLKEGSSYIDNLF